jgi:DNA-binding transcriptional ArsR family regulator
MLPQVDVSVEFARALADPMRIRILGALREGPRSPAVLAEELDIDRRTLTRQARRLETLGFLSVLRDGHGRVLRYDLAAAPDFVDAVWERLPPPVKQAAISGSLAQIYSTVSKAAADGGFNRADMHLTRTPLTLDEQGWAEISRDMMHMLVRLAQTQARAAERLARRGSPEAPVRANAVLMLFTTKRAHDLDRPEPEPGRFTPEEGLTHALDITEALERGLTSKRTPWASVARLADELRVVARAAMASEGEPSTAPIPHD